MALQPLADFPAEALRRLRFVLADIDDTVTEDGRLPAASLEAMERLSAAGLHVIPVTGRPAGWCDHIARMWPVDAVVGENGAFYFAYDPAQRRMHQGFAKSAEARKTDRRRLEQLREHILAAVPGSGVASDQDYRIADLAIDFCEDVAPLSDDAVARIVTLFKEAGATAKVSSIHVNGWFGDYDKLSMTRRCLKERFGLDMDRAKAEIVFAGDSPNDQPMFAYFENAVGVANVRDFDLAAPPNWITRQRSAAGFQELADAILEAR
ncbi:HAD family hydrolase [Pelagibius sp.]|uniref:HAD family hydrolase n=1 Tax=Pelagibius sp. TaxID=1931238 RepID=UPI003BAF1876